LLTNIYGTLARNYNLPDKARIPADAMRKITSDFITITDDGKILATGRITNGKPHTNFTLDRPVLSHKKDNGMVEIYIYSQQMIS